MSTDEYLRQSGLVNQELLKELRIAIIGVGSIGSFTALALTKMGCGHLTFWDNDTVSSHNISNQFFAKESIEGLKTAAVMQECKRYTPTEVEIETYSEFYNGQNLDKFDIVIALTDNIEGRKAAFEQAKLSKKTLLFIDGRMGGELFRTFSFNPKDETKSREYYNDYIDGVVNDTLPCTERTIIYNVLMVASLIASFVKKYVQKQEIPFELLMNFATYSPFVKTKFVPIEDTVLSTK